MEKTRRTASFRPQFNRPAVIALALFFAGTSPPINAGEDHRNEGAVDIKVAGNRLTDDEGRSVRLIGVSRSSLEFQCHVDHATPSDLKRMRAWGMNAIRFTLSSALWNGGCPDYRKTLADTVKTALDAGMYVVLALQWNAPFGVPANTAAGGAQYPMPDRKTDLAFWRDVAGMFRNDARVLFNLFSEPFGVSCAQWYLGGAMTVNFVNDPKGKLIPGAYSAIGMNDLAAAVRAVAPRNVIVVSGIDWGYDLSCVTSGYAVHTDNVAYATHPFDYMQKQANDWDRAFGVPALTHVVLAEEFGQYNCKTDYISAVLETFKNYEMSWLAWNWSVAGGCEGPALLSDWEGTPSEPYGAFVRSAAIAASPLSRAP